MIIVRCAENLELVQHIFNNEKKKNSNWRGECLCYTVKKAIDFPVPSRDITNKLSLAGSN